MGYQVLRCVPWSHGESDAVRTGWGRNMSAKPAMSSVSGWEGARSLAPAVCISYQCTRDIPAFCIPRVLLALRLCSLPRSRSSLSQSSVCYRYLHLLSVPPKPGFTHARRNSRRAEYSRGDHHDALLLPSRASRISCTRATLGVAPGRSLVALRKAVAAPSLLSYRHPPARARCPHLHERTRTRRQLPARTAQSIAIARFTLGGVFARARVLVGSRP